VGRAKSVRLKVGGGYIELKDYVEKTYGKKFKLSIKDSVKLKVMEEKRALEQFDSAYTGIKMFFVDLMKKHRDARLELAAKEAAEKSA